jgi:hypothetical protein
MSGKPTKVQAIEQLSVLATDNSKIAVVQVRTKEGTMSYAMNREALEQLAELLSKNATRFEYSVEKKSN